MEHKSNFQEIDCTQIVKLKYKKSKQLQMGVQASKKEGGLIVTPVEITLSLGKKNLAHE